MRGISGISINMIGGGLHAIEHVLCSLAPMEVRCDPSDLSCQHTRRDGDLHRDKLLLFETARGGTGLAQRLGPALGRLLRAAHKVVSECGCAEGCYGCIVSGSCYEEGLDKVAAREILTYLVQGGRMDGLEGGGSSGVGGDSAGKAKEEGGGGGGDGDNVKETAAQGGFAGKAKEGGGGGGKEAPEKEEKGEENRGKGKAAKTRRQKR